MISGWLSSGVILPPVIRRAGERATERLIEFFIAHIRNPNTRCAYGRVAWDFFAYIDERNVALEELQPCMSLLGSKLKRDDYEVASVKQHLAAVRRSSITSLPAAYSGIILRQRQRTAPQRAAWQDARSGQQ